MAIFADFFDTHGVDAVLGESKRHDLGEWTDSPYAGLSFRTMDEAVRVVALYLGVVS